MSLESDLLNYITNSQKKLKKELDNVAFSVFKSGIFSNDDTLENSIANDLVSAAFPSIISNREILKQLDKFFDHYNSVENPNSFDEIRASWFERYERFAYAMTLYNLERAKQALSEGNLIEAIESIRQATHCMAVMDENRFTNDLKSMGMSNAAKTRHKPKTEKKATAVKEYEQNRDSYISKDDAAEKLSSKYRLGFSTIRKALRNV
jgi:hypothetical protein